MTPPADMTREERRAALLDCMDRSSRLIANLRYPVRTKQVLGGRFGAGGFLLCSYHEINAGLDDVIYFVAHEKTGYVFGVATSRAEALDFARDILNKVDSTLLQTRMQRHKNWRDEEAARRAQEREQELERRRSEMRVVGSSKVRSIPRRRKQIFDECGGKCHYCSTALTLDGKWHIEHKMPRALGGGNEPGNLVASCVPCNMKKRDTTDQEFKARIDKERSA